MGRKDNLIDLITDEIETWSISDLEDLYDEISGESESDEGESD